MTYTDPDFDGLTLAIPKGRLAKEILPILQAVGLTPEDAFFDDKDRRLIFRTERDDVRLVPIKPFDAATFVAHGGADLGIVGSDVLHEFNFSEVYSPVDLGIGYCRLSVAAQDDYDFVPEAHSHVRICTKYPNLTKTHFAAMGIQAECIKLNGSIELGPKLGMSDLIVDIVTTGNTLRANGLKEVSTLVECTSRLITNRSRTKTNPALFAHWIAAFNDAVNQQKAAA